MKFEKTLPVTFSYQDHQVGHIDLDLVLASGFPGGNVLECLSGGTNAFLTGPVTLLVMGNYSRESCLGRVYETAYDPIQYPAFSSPRYIGVGVGKKQPLFLRATQELPNPYSKSAP